MIPVSEMFIERWAGIYMDKHKADGELAAQGWFLKFIPKAEQARVFNAIRENRNR